MGTISKAHDFRVMTGHLICTVGSISMIGRNMYGVVALVVDAVVVAY